jgi:hypothetical protein
LTSETEPGAMTLALLRDSVLWLTPDWPRIPTSPVADFWRHRAEASISPTFSTRANFWSGSTARRAASPELATHTHNSPLANNRRMARSRSPLAGPRLARSKGQGHFNLPTLQRLAGSKSSGFVRCRGQGLGYFLSLQNCVAVRRSFPYPQRSRPAKA